MEKAGATRKNGAIDRSPIHRWYQTVLGYSHELVEDVLDRFGIGTRHRVIDPFCGAATTLVECLKRGVSCVGIDANPASCLVARVKTDQTLRPDRLRHLLADVGERYGERLATGYSVEGDPTYRYLHSAGMVERGWISPEPLRKVLVLKASILALGTSAQYKNALMLGLLAEVVNGASNVRFGPELYCVTAKLDSDVFGGFSQRIVMMIEDINGLRGATGATARVFEGDARNYYDMLQFFRGERFSAVISSPPYPAEHDYTRNARLELALLEHVTSRESLRTIKKRMIRSHTKGIYKQDRDRLLVRDDIAVQSIVKEVRRKIVGKDYGFARLYPRVVQEYFGGMKRHLRNMRRFLRPEAQCAYIVGDQSSYLRVHIPTAELLSSIAEEVGFEVVEIRRWRTRWSTTTSKSLDENILVLRNPG